MRAIKTLAMQEPLVDTVDPEQLATQPCLLATFDLNTMTKAEAAFSVLGPTPRPNPMLSHLCVQMPLVLHSWRSHWSASPCAAYGYLMEKGFGLILSAEPRV